MKDALICKNKIVAGLDSNQAILQVFRNCTAHKMTHLFAADVVQHPMKDMPDNWNMWNSDMTSAFSEMIDSLICSVTNRDSIPRHSHLISTMATARGGLGIQHPRNAAIPTFILTTRRNLQFANDGIWMGDTLDKAILPNQIKSLYIDWKSSQAHTFQIFRKYYTQIANISVSPLVDDVEEFFLNKSSLNTCRERVKIEAASRTKTLLEHTLKDYKDSHDQLEDLLDPKLAYSLLDMSRLPQKQ
jgi:hypothetical protein